MSAEVAVAPARRKRRADSGSDADDAGELELAAWAAMPKRTQHGIHRSAAIPARKRRTLDEDPAELPSHTANGVADAHRMTADMAHLPIDRKTLDAAVQKTLDRSRKDIDTSNMLEYCKRTPELDGLANGHVEEVSLEAENKTNDIVPEAANGGHVTLENPPTNPPEPPLVLGSSDVQDQPIATAENPSKTDSALVSARTSATHFNRSTQFRLDVAQHKDGPLSGTTSSQSSSLPSSLSYLKNTSGGVLAFTPALLERVDAIETSLGLGNQGGISGVTVKPVPHDMWERLRRVEERLMELEEAGVHAGLFVDQTGRARTSTSQSSNTARAYSLANAVSRPVLSNRSQSQPKRLDTPGLPHKLSLDPPSRAKVPPSSTAPRSVAPSTISRAAGTGSAMASSLPNAKRSTTPPSKRSAAVSMVRARVEELKRKLSERGGGTK